MPGAPRASRFAGNDAKRPLTGQDVWYYFWMAGNWTPAASSGGPS